MNALVLPDAASAACTADTTHEADWPRAADAVWVDTRADQEVSEPQFSFVCFVGHHIDGANGQYAQAIRGREQDHVGIPTTNKDVRKDNKDVMLKEVEVSPPSVIAT